MQRIQIESEKSGNLCQGENLSDSMGVAFPQAPFVLFLPKPVLALPKLRNKRSIIDQTFRNVLY